MEVRRFELAAQELHAAIADDPQDADLYCLLAECFRQQGLSNRALDAARDAVAADPENDSAHYTLALVHLDRHEFRRAERAARRAVEIDPEDAWNHWALGCALLQQEKAEQAMAEVEAGLAVDPTHVECLNLRAETMLALGEDGVREAIDESLAADPEQAEAFTLQGWQRLFDGDRPAALEAFHEALRLDPESTEARNGILEAHKHRFRLYRWSARFGRHALRPTKEDEEEPIQTGLVWLVVAYVIVRLNLDWRGVYPIAVTLHVVLVFLMFALLFVDEVTNILLVPARVRRSLQTTETDVWFQPVTFAFACICAATIVAQGVLAHVLTLWMFVVPVLHALFASASLCAREGAWFAAGYVVWAAAGVAATVVMPIHPWPALGAIGALTLFGLVIFLRFLNQVRDGRLTL